MKKIALLLCVLAALGSAAPVSASNGYVMSAADWHCWHLDWSAHICAKGYLREIRRKDGGGGAGFAGGRLRIRPSR